VDRVSGEPVVRAETYARWRATPLGRITEQVETDVIFGLAGSLAGKRVLDVGTGDGTYAIEAAKRGAHATAVDAQIEMREAARARAVDRAATIDFLEGRAETLPFDDARFDVVFAVTVLCFVPDAGAAVREMARVLAPWRSGGSRRAESIQRLGDRAPRARVARGVDVEARALLVESRAR